MSGESKKCTVENCERLARAKGLCNMHYFRLRAHGSTDTPPARVTAKKKCSEVGCENHARCKGFCGKHYQYWKYGRYSRESTFIEKPCRDCGAAMPRKIWADGQKESPAQYATRKYWGIIYMTPLEDGRAL